MKHICTHTCRQTLSPVSRSNTLAPVPCVRPPAPCFPPPPAPAIVSNHGCVRHPLCRLASHSPHPEPPHHPRLFPPRPAPAWLATTLENRNRINVKVCDRSHSHLITAPSSGGSIRTIVATSNPLAHHDRGRSFLEMLELVRAECSENSDTLHCSPHPPFHLVTARMCLCLCMWVIGAHCPTNSTSLPPRYGARNFKE